MNKLFAIIAVALASVSANAQDVWEMPEENNTPQTIQQDSVATKKQVKTTAPDPDEKYLKGAVTEVDGRVAWSFHVDLPGKEAQQVYDATYKALSEFTKQEGMLKGSRVALINKKEHIVVALVKEWLVFNKSFITLDRAKYNYTLIARCADGGVDISLERIFFNYDENNGKGEQKIAAEEAINDANALFVKQNRLVPGWARFRRKAIDRKDEVFGLLSKAIIEKAK